MMSDVFHVLGVPAGREVLVTIAATAGNVVTNKTPGVGKRWVLLRGTMTLVCNATVGNRTIEFQVTNGTVITEFLGYSVNITANETVHISLGEVRFQANITLEVRGYWGISPIVLHGADQFRITVNGGLAGDSYSGYLVVLEVDA